MMMVVGVISSVDAVDVVNNLVTGTAQMQQSQATSHGAQ
jgi:hypothetical protein